METFTKTEIELRKQLNIYVDKFKQVEETLNKSNELFMTFRKEMEQVCLFCPITFAIKRYIYVSLIGVCIHQMTKKTKKLEKENSAIKGKCDTMNKNILEMAEEVCFCLKLFSKG